MRVRVRYVGKREKCGEKDQRADQEYLEVHAPGRKVGAFVVRFGHVCFLCDSGNWAMSQRGLAQIEALLRDGEPDQTVSLPRQPGGDQCGKKGSGYFSANG